MSGLLSAGINQARVRINNWIRSTPLFPIYLRRKAASEADLKFFSQFISTDSLVFDIGANVGHLTRIFDALGARVVSLEPQRRCFAVLQKVYHDHPRVTLINKAAGPAEGAGEIAIATESGLSSMSEDWRSAVQGTGRFTVHRWEERQGVVVTTIDRLIAEYGRPDFVKVDVEGFEFSVISGLSQPVRCLSLEFTPERMQPTYDCIGHLEKLGKVELNWSECSDPRLELARWISPGEMRALLRAKEGGLEKRGGDLYVRFS